MRVYLCAHGISSASNSKDPSSCSLTLRIRTRAALRPMLGSVRVTIEPGSRRMSR